MAEKELEFSIIGTMLNNVSCQTVGFTKLSKPLIFEDENAQLAFKYLLEIFVSQQELDAFVFKDYLIKKKAYKRIGGDDVFERIISYDIGLPNFEQRLDILLQSYVYRVQIQVAKQIEENATSRSKAPHEIVHESIEQIEGSLVVDRSESVKTLGQNLSLLDRQMQRGKTEDISGISTGYPELDKFFKFKGGKFGIIGARPSAGKTASALEMARRISFFAQEPVGMFSLEMTGLEYTTRIASRHLSINSYVFDEKLNFNDEQKFQNFRQQFATAPLYMDDDASLDYNALLSRIIWMYRKYKIKIFFIDHLGLVKLSSQNKNLKQNEMLDEFSRSIKRLARKLDITIVGLYQLSREVEKRDPPRPMLSDLYNSSSFEADSDWVIFLFRPDYYEKCKFDPLKPTKSNNAPDLEHLRGKYIAEIWKNGECYREDVEGKCEWIIAKNRGGKTGRIWMDFDKSIGSFEYNQHLSSLINKK